MIRVREGQYISVNIDFTKYVFTKSSLFDDLRIFYQIKVFLKLKIRTFGKYGQRKRVDYRGATKNLSYIKFYLMNQEKFLESWK